MSLYTENIPDLPGSGAICSAPVSVGAEIWEGRNPSMSRKAFSLRRSRKLAFGLQLVILLS